MLFKTFLVTILQKSYRTSKIYMGTTEEKIRLKLEATFNPTFLQIINESNKHNVPKGSETHFKVVVVSDSFDGKSLLERHRKINEVLKDDLDNGVHALSITAKTLKQWEDGNHSVPKSPPCLGGSGL